MDTITLRGNGCDYEHVPVAKSFWERWRGLKSQSDGSSLLIKTNAINSRGMDRPFLAVGLDDGCAVTEVRVIEAGEFAWFAGSRWVLELPVASRPPSVGDVFELCDE